jgi:hypothetical protein
LFEGCKYAVERLRGDAAANAHDLGKAEMVFAGGGDHRSNVALRRCSSMTLKKNPVTLLYEGVSEDLRIKRITPEMQVRMERLEKAGCDETANVKDPRIGKAISYIPGGGQFYNNEPVKGIYYMATSIFIIPYFLSIEDARQTRDYLNFQSALEYCEEKLRLTGKKPRG